jgi:carbon-monoxide dehydrogenase medium subunit
MKPAPFSYHAPSTVREVVSLLAEFQDEGRVLAGGQSLIPLMNFRLAQPAHLIDVNPVSELDYVRRDDGWLAVGARTRLAAAEASAEVAQHAPLLRDALELVAHPTIRHRGTVAGSLAHADPAAELPAVALAMDADMVVTSGRGTRIIAAADLYQGPFSTSLEADELLTECRFPTWPRAGTASAFLEFTRTHGNFAVVGTAVLVHLYGDRIDRVAVALCGVGGKPVRATRAEAHLVGKAPSTDLVAAAAEAAATGLEPASDLHGSGDFRRKLARVLVGRALELAFARAEKGRRSPPPRPSPAIGEGVEGGR